MSTPILATAADLDIMARTLWAEARGEGIPGMMAVAHVICERRRRRRWYGKSVPGFDDHTIAAVCRKEWQFSCWNAGDPNLPKLLAVDLSDRHFRRAMLVACAVVNGEAGYGDITQGSDHYYAMNTPIPKWARGRQHVVAIGRHLFFNDIP
ncbi:cell wall hydrolase [Caenispirillum bisanense]|uniref:Cell Wall Hydrolase n=1 Tax=Caenispirillum bisanense TaxID=414052 RepID=A0A286GYN6_9PROT|nr:cell wall hydrolase [Caenispirillum bisanense]SOE00645.1 Cell Wall Hydrolase [Caenispirillum bisanense]